MGSINSARMILGGLVAGAVINACEFVLHEVVLKAEWKDALRAINRPGEFSAAQTAAYGAWGFGIGMAAAWLYAAIRPRFGPGPGTATTAGVAVWLVGYAGAMAGPAIQGLYPWRLIAVAVSVALVEIVGATILSAAIYQENPGSGSRAAAGRRG